MKVDAAFLDYLQRFFLPRRGDSTVGGNIIPDANETHNLGSATNRYDTVYAKTLSADTLSGSTSVDTVDGFHAYASPQPDSLLALDGDSKFPTSTYPSALLVDGTRNLTGNLTVDPAITIDGVDISNFKSSYDTHVADPDAHHDRVTVSGDGLALNVQQISLVHGITPTGLTTYSSNSEGVEDESARGDHSHQILVAAPNQPLSAITGDAAGTASTFARSDHYHSINTTGTPSTITYASTTPDAGSAAGIAKVDHEHAITTITDASGPTQGILASTAAGGLILATLNVQGNLDVTNGGNLTVGTNVLYVDNGVSPGVGVNMAPDPQFALDVSGSLRVSDWIVGSHAMQIEGAIAIMHWDGRRPFKEDYSGYYTSHMGHPVTWSVGYGTFFEEGKFNKGISLHINTTNLVLDPSGEGSSWSGFGGTTVTESDVGPPLHGCLRGAGCVKAVTENQSADANGARFSSFTASATSTSHVLQIAVWAPSGATLTVLVRNEAWANLLSEAITGTGQWERYYWTFTSDATTTANHRIDVREAALTDTITFWVDEVMVHDGTVPRSFAYGDQGVVEQNTWQAGSAADGGSRWSGTAHASTTARIRTQVYYGYNSAENLLGPDDFLWGKGTLGFWLKTTCDMDATYSTMTGYSDLFAWTADGSSNGIRFETRGADGGILQFWVGDQDSTAVSWWDATNGWYMERDTWHHFVLTWDVDEIDPTDGTDDRIRLYVDGDDFGAPQSGSQDTFTGFFYDNSASAWRFGNTANVTNDLLPDAVMDDFFILDRAMMPDEIKALYDSDAPIFAETSTVGFQGGGAIPVWADEEGLWMRDTDGTTVFGYSAVDGKSWGGRTLNKGDYQLGYYGASDGGWLWWDKDGYSSNALLKLGYGTTDVFTIDSSGADLIGTLTVTSPGTIIAGNGNVTIDAAGIKLDGGSTSIRDELESNTTIEWYNTSTESKMFARLRSDYTTSPWNTHTIELYSYNYDTNNRMSQIAVQTWYGNTTFASSTTNAYLNMYTRRGATSGDLYSGIGIYAEGVTFSSFVQVGNNGIVDLEGTVYSQDSILVGYSASEAVSKELRLYYNGTAVGQIKVQDATWLRINQDYAYNIYTPRAFAAAGGIASGTSTLPGGGDVGYTGNLRAYKNSTYLDMYAYHPLTTAIASSTFYGTTKGNTSGGTYSAASEFSGLPANCVAIQVAIACQHSSSGQYLQIGPSSGQGTQLELYTNVANTYNTIQGRVNLSGGNFYFGSTVYFNNLYLRCIGYYI